MKNIALYGMITNDQISFFENFHLGESNQPVALVQRSGGIANLARVFENHYLDNISSCQVYDFCDTINILIARNMRRTQYVERSHRFDRLQARPADWHHIAYIDKLHWLDASFMSSLQGTVSVDLADDILDVAFLQEIAKYTDYWFMSKENMTTILEPEILKVLKGMMLIHDPCGCEIIRGDSRIYVHNKTYSLSNTLGAGDYFAAHFMAIQLASDSAKDVETVVREAQKRTLLSIRTLNEQI